MKTTHARMTITHAEVDALVPDVVAALDKLKVPNQEQNDLPVLLAPMRKDIVEVP